ncbi:hypothetical protein B1756_11230 [Natrarchaeobaculum aegyptiacum]|uniref:Uncharacterized protein n=1 Tax=Natrarchaeobaculum aegyptiacum TaxID=745377 RepID=A0A2Z2HSV1_9EURY|nr:hypothetical protein B1756_11230 [Natrarchaeobaculum aegyptiacum]
MAVGPGIAGCVTDRRDGEVLTDAVLTTKRIRVDWESAAGSFRTHVLSAYPDQSTLRGTVAAEIDDVVRSIDDIRVPESVDDRLRSAFDDFAYAVGVGHEDADEEDTGDETITFDSAPPSTVSREQFNRLQFGDSLDVRLSGTSFDPNLELLERNEGRHDGPTEMVISSRDFSDVHSGRDPPSI